jgi:hypothetical protein
VGGSVKASPKATTEEGKSKKAKGESGKAVQAFFTFAFRLFTFAFVTAGRS